MDTKTEGRCGAGSSASAAATTSRANTLMKMAIALTNSAEGASTFCMALFCLPGGPSLRWQTSVLTENLMATTGAQRSNYDCGASSRPVVLLFGSELSGYAYCVSKGPAP